MTAADKSKLLRVRYVESSAFVSPGAGGWKPGGFPIPRRAIYEAELINLGLIAVFATASIQRGKNKT